MNRFKIVYKLIFHFLNIFIIILSIYPGSLLGCYLFNDCNYDPQITKDFILSTNHLYAFSILTLFGILAFNKNSNIKFLFIYLIFISIILELLHIVINYCCCFSNMFYLQILQQQVDGVYLSLNFLQYL